MALYLCVCVCARVSVCVCEVHSWSDVILLCIKTTPHVYMCSHCLIRCLQLVQLAGRDAPSNLIAFAQKTLKDGAIVSKLHVIELGGAPGVCVCLCSRVYVCE